MAEADPPSQRLTPDRAALKKVGERVRRRLAADPSASRLPTDHAELYAVADFLGAAECDRLIAMVDAVAQPSTLYRAEGAGDARTSYSGDVDRFDPFVRMVERRIDDLLGLPNSWGETVQGQRYREGQQFKPHCDWFETEEEYWAGESRNGGQRSWTAMIYLNDVEAGGETAFTALDMAIPPQRGALLTWNNATPEGEPNRMTIHAGTPVIRGTKYVVTKWYRTRPWAHGG